MLSRSCSQTFFLSESFSPESFGLILKTLLEKKHEEEKDLINKSFESILKNTIFLPCQDIWQLISSLYGILEYKSSQTPSDNNPSKNLPLSVVIIDNIDLIISSACSNRIGIDSILLNKLQRALSRTSHEGNCLIIVCNII